MHWKIPFGELKINKKSKSILEKVIESNFISGGNITKQLENSWGKLFDYKYNLAISSGTSADMAACIALYDFGAERGDEIIAPALAFAAVGNSILAAGFKPSFVDIEKNTLNINPNKIEEKINKKTKAIMAVHTMGKPCDMNAISTIAKKYHLKIIEDCCEAHGAKFNGRYVGHFGDIATFSYYVAHIISCGDGGMLSTNNKNIFNILDSIKNHGRKKGSLYFDHIRHGLNFRMNDLVASIGLPDVNNFKKIFDKRKSNLNYLIENTKDLENFAYFNFEEKNEIISPHAFSIVLKDPKLDYKKFYNYLESNLIQCKRNFGSMPTQHNAFSFLEYKIGDFPEAEYVGDNGLHLGVHQYLSKKDLNYILDKLHKYFL